jgi:hypothetical protein
MKLRLRSCLAGPCFLFLWARNNLAYYNAYPVIDRDKTAFYGHLIKMFDFTSDEGKSWELLAASCEPRGRASLMRYTPVQHSFTLHYELRSFIRTGLVKIKARLLLRSYWHTSMNVA